MTNFIRRGERIPPKPCYRMDFDNPKERGAGCSFPCTEDGEIIKDEHYETWKDTLEACLSGSNGLIPKGVQTYYTLSYWQPGIIECDCGEQITLISTDYEECGNCGRLYNGSGQALAPRRCWDQQGEY